MGVFSHIYKRPRLNQSWNNGEIVTHHEEETWLQLFIDLLYVAFFMTLGKGIAHCEHYEKEKEADVLGAAGLLFSLLFGLRYDIDLYANRFHSRDLVTRILYFIFTCGVAVMSVHIYRVDAPNACPLLGLQSKAVMVGFIFGHSSIVFLNGIALYKNPRVQPQLGLEFFLSLVYLLAALIAVGPIKDGHLIDFFRVSVPLSYLLRTEFIGQFIRPYFNQHLGPYLFCKDPGPLQLERDIIPLNIHVHQVRLVMFIMIATGEGLIQIIYPSLPNDASYMDRIYIFVIACVVILFSLAMLYADAVVRNPHHGDHAMKRDSKIAGVVWTFCHVILGYFIFLVGICIELSIAFVYENEPAETSYDTLMGTCLGAATLIMTLMRSTHKGLNSEEGDEEGRLSWSRVLRRKINYAFRITISLAHFLLAYLEHNSGGVDSDDAPASAHSFGVSGDDAPADTVTTYHHIRRQDKFYCLHATFLALSLLIEVAGSFLCKKKDRSTMGASFSFTPRRMTFTPKSETELMPRDAANSSEKSVSFDEGDSSDNDKL